MIGRVVGKIAILKRFLACPILMSLAHLINRQVEVFCGIGRHRS